MSRLPADERLSDEGSVATVVLVSLEPFAVGERHARISGIDATAGPQATGSIRDCDRGDLIRLGLQFDEKTVQIGAISLA